MHKDFIKKAFIDGITKFPNLEPSEVWKDIYFSHVNDISKIDNYDVISNIIYADRNWRKLSDCVLEEIIMDFANSSLTQHSKDVIEGAKFWTEQRQWFNHIWKPTRTII